ncbi:nuclear transport factor 2 family protein [Leptospira ellisii]|uniref:Nuclear transport factor 2 family protein n=1 Tax=Leptospira ellisii TaxID=2023197 RepID=A0AAE4TXQ3_9LEPT|nr:nuclear transport factor 2 family protein [Leptospira ellisii]MDV6235639.1 nuclear transport factor 2 family protein [Leptospira ellisii]
MELEKLIEQWLAAWTSEENRNQYKVLADFYHENVFYSDPFLTEGVKGKTSLSAYLRPLLRRNPNWIWTAEEIFPTAKGCTLKWKARIPIGETTREIYGCDIVEIESSKLIRNEVYFDVSVFKSEKPG